MTHISLRSRALPLPFTFAVALVTAACSRSRGPSLDVSASPSAQARSTAATLPSAPAPDGSAPDTKPSSPLVLIEVGPGSFEITTTRETSLGASLELERAEGDSFVRLADLDGGKGLTLTTSCATPLSGCVSLTPERPLVPVAWSGLHCAAQCNGSCRAEASYTPGKYRVSVSTCEGRRASELAFAMPEGPIEGLERAWAGTKLVSGVVARLALPSGKPGWDMTEPRTKGEMAGMPERTPERPMDPRALTALGEILRKKDGYDDRIMKRCLMSRIFGFRVTRELTTTGPARSAELEIVMDLQCAKIFVVREGAPGKKRVVHASHFDPQREAVATLARELFPEAKDLRAP